MLVLPMCCRGTERLLVQAYIYVAFRCYTAAGDTAAVRALERVRWIEEKALLAGHLHALVFGQHDRAEVMLPAAGISTADSEQPLSMRERSGIPT